MSQANPLGLIGQYGFSDDDSDEETMSRSSKMRTDLGNKCSTPATSEDLHGTPSSAVAPIHPAPIAHCQWSACYDESSGFTYYWNQQTNAVTWEPPQEYLLALKVASQQLQVVGTTEVSAQEWQLYQQALSEKQKGQNKLMPKLPMGKPPPAINKPVASNKNKTLPSRKRPSSDSEEEKIQLITSYHDSDSESNDEAETPKKAPEPPPKELIKSVTIPAKKQKTKPQVKEFGPALPSNQNYSVPIGPELPSMLTVEAKPVEQNISEKNVVSQKKLTAAVEDSQDENILLKKLRDKTKLLEKLGGEIPNDLKKLITDENSSVGSPDCNKAPSDGSADSRFNMETTVDDLLEEIEKKERKNKKTVTVDMFGEETNNKVPENVHSVSNSPIVECHTPPLDAKPLFACHIATVEGETQKSLFPSSASITINAGNELEVIENTSKPPHDKKGTNLYLMDKSEIVEKVGKKKLRISNSVLPDKKKIDVPAYSTKYAHFVEGFSSSERTGLGFNRNGDAEGADSPKPMVNYGKGLMFTKGETLNDERRLEEEAEKEKLADTVDLLNAKLNFLNQQQVYPITPVQEMTVQIQTLCAAYSSGALAIVYWRRWLDAAIESLTRLEATAAPSGWICQFHRKEGRYQYRRVSDGLTQWDYPIVSVPGHDDMDICTTPPPEDVEDKTPPPPPTNMCPATPPPPPWVDPPPPGCDDVLPPPPPLPTQPPLPPAPPVISTSPRKESLGDELLSFYNDIAEIDKQTVSVPTVAPAPEDKAKVKEKPLVPPVLDEKADSNKDVDVKTTRKKSKVKISASVGLKHKSVSHLVAKWQQVADEINSD